MYVKGLEFYGVPGKKHLKLLAVFIILPNLAFILTMESHQGRGFLSKIKISLLLCLILLTHVYLKS